MSKFQVGDRCVIIRCYNHDELLGARCTITGVHTPYEMFYVDIDGVAPELYRVKKWCPYASQLRKIDDDQDDFWSEDPGIPEEILQGFRCDETLPVPIAPYYKINGD